MSSGFGNLSPLGRCYPVFMVRLRPPLSPSRPTPIFASFPLRESPPDLFFLFCAFAVCCVCALQEFRECMSTSPDSSACKDLREDYMECLHHKKEITRFNALQEERVKKMKAGEAVPPLASQQLKKGEIKLPWTTA